MSYNNIAAAASLNEATAGYTPKAEDFYEMPQDHQPQQEPQQELRPPPPQAKKPAAPASPFAHIKNPKERRLAELVSEKAKTRHTQGAAGFRKEQNRKIKELVTDLLSESEKTEEQTFVDENEIFFKAEDGFFRQQDESEVYSLKGRQQAEYRALKSMQDSKMGDVKKRVQAKKFQREQIRELKNVYNTTRQQEIAYRKTQDLRETLFEQRERGELIVQQMEERHITQIKQFNAAEERRIDDQRVLTELSIRHLNEDQRAESLKEHASRMSHQKNIDKKKLDQLRERQRLELRHFKDKLDYETRMTEEFGNLSGKQALEERTLRFNQRQEYIVEKERMLATHAQVKQLELQNENLSELRRLQVHHKMQLRQLSQAQKVRREKRIKHWSNIIGRDVSIALKKGGSGGNSQSSSVASKSGQQSAVYTRQASSVNQNNGGKGPGDVLNLLGDQDDGEDDTAVMLGVEQQNTAKQQLKDMQDGLLELKKKHEDSLANVQAQHQEDYKRKQEDFNKAMMELEWEQEIEVKDMRKSDEAQIEEALTNQKKEMAMETNIRETESKQFQERRILNQILDGVDDSVISMDTRGYISRFNASAAKVWGYKPEEVIGKNIKMLMPKRYSKDHDVYLWKYLSTGIKRVIGKRRELEALKKDGTEFPVTLLVSEVIEEGVHLFNAFIRDETQKYTAVREREAEEACLPQMIWKVNTNGDAYFLNQRFIDYTGVSEGNVFDPAVVQPEDARMSWKAFQEANKTKESFECKRRLKGTNGTYRWFLTRGSPILDEKNEIISWCGSCTDVDVATKLQLEAEALPEVLPQALWKSDLDGNVLFANSNFLNYIGAKKIDGLNVFSPTIIHKEDVKKSRALFDHAVEKGAKLETKRRILGVNGQYKWFLTRGSPVMDEDGTVLAFYGTCTDVHDETLQAIEMAALPESLPQLVWKADPKGNVKYANKRFMGYVGATEYTGLNVFADSVVHPDDYKASLQAFAKGTKEKAEFSLQRRLKDKNGEYHKMKTIGVPIMDDEKNILGWYGTCTQL